MKKTVICNSPVFFMHENFYFQFERLKLFYITGNIIFAYE